MARVLVTGGTGVVGSRVVLKLVASGAEVRVLTRRERPELPEGAEAVRGTLNTGDGLAHAVEGVDAIVHCASATRLPLYRRARKTDVDGTRRLLDALGGARPHLVYISIVGVDRIPLGYYRAKLETERVIERSGVPRTILRTTQFHEFVARLIGMATRQLVGVVPKGVNFQPVDAGEVADRLAGFVETGPQSRAADMGGPEVRSAVDLTLTYLQARGIRKPVAAVSLPGKVARSFREGANLVPEHADGTVTWEEWIKRKVAP